ncbi:MAG: queuosine precursor transporter [Desulfurococcaceae archaeon]
MEIWLLWVSGLSLSTIAGAVLVKKYRDSYGYTVLVSLYVSFILISNILASRLVVYDIFGISVVTAGATLLFPFISQIIDMINEVYGRRSSYMAIFITLIANIIASVLIWQVAFEQPAVEVMEVPPVYEEAWRFYVLQTPRIVIASYTAFWVANTLDAKIFADLKKYFYSRYKEAYRSLKTITLFVLIRSILSDLANMLVDSLVFFPIAFALTIPWESMPDVIFGGTYVKLVVVVLTQPFLIAYRWLIREVSRVID